MNFMRRSKAAEFLGVHAVTIQRWGREGTIRTALTPGGQRVYDVDSLVGEKKRAVVSTICYCRVSSRKQRDDLERQVAFMRERFPDAEIIEDIASGLNFKRSGLRRILDRLMNGEAVRLVVAHKDRLARFGFDLIKFLVEKNGGNVVVLDRTELSPEKELVEDILAILLVFSCRMHGLRKYRKQIKEEATSSDENV